MKHRYSIISVIVTSFWCSSILAVPYSLPSDDGWYQLQNSTTHETVCQTGDAQPCDVPEGDYVLLNFKGETTPEGMLVRVPVVIELPSRTLIVHVVSECLDVDILVCETVCPMDYIPSGISCDLDSSNTTDITLGHFDEAGGYCSVANSESIGSIRIRLACVKE